MPYIGRDLNRGNYLKLDDISSSFNSSTKTFNLTVGGSAFTPGSAFSILVSVGGVIQEPESAYQVNNSEITFANAPTAQDSFFCIALGVALGIGVPGNGTVNGTQLAKPFNYDGYFYLDDTNNRVGINSSSPTVALDVIGDINLNGNLLTGIGGTLGGTLFGNVYSTSGISTFYDLRVTNNLTVEGTTTTLDTNLIGVDRVEVGADSDTVVGVAITQSGTADIVNLFDGATEVLTVTDGGNVGINSTTPYEKLDVVGNVDIKGGTNGLRITSSAPGVKFTDSDAPGGYGFIGVNNTSGSLVMRSDDQNALASSYMGFEIDGVQRVGIASDGDVTITGYNNAELKLKSGNANADGYLAFINNAGITSGRIAYDHQYDKMTFNIGGTGTGTEKLRIQSNGTVGIGTDNPVAKLQLEHSGLNAELFRTWTTTGSVRREYFLKGPTSGNGNDPYRWCTGNSHSWEVDGEEKMRIDYQGSVGIGTVTPDRMLHILGTGNAIVKMEANYSGSVTGIEGVLTASGADRYVTGVYGKVVNTSGTESNVASIRLWNQQASPTTSDSPGYITFNTTNDSASTATEKVRITSGGSVLIDTTVTSEVSGDFDDLVIGSTSDTQKGISIVGSTTSGVGSLTFTDGASYKNQGIIQYRHADDSMRFTTAQYEALRILSDGKVGIGTTTGNGLINTRHGYGTNQQVLHVRADLGSSNGRSLNLFTPDTDNSTAPFRFQTGNGFLFQCDGENVLLINHDRLVGIGTDAPTYKLHVDSGDAAIGLWKSRRSSGSYIDYSLGADGAALGYIGAGGQIISSAGADSGDFAIRSQGDLLFSSHGSVEALRIGSSGNIGINETSPAARLHISTPASTTCELRLTANNTGSGAGDRGRINVYSALNDGTAYQAGYVDIDRSSGTDDIAHLLVALNDGNSVGERLRIASNGHVTISSGSYEALTIKTNNAGVNGPEISLFHNSSSPAVNDVVGQLRYTGRDSATNITLYSKIETKVDNVTDGQETGFLDFSTRGLGAYNSIFRLKNRSTASAPSYTADDMNGIILDVYNTGNPYPRYMNFIAKSGGNTDSNIDFWTETVGGSPIDRLRIDNEGSLRTMNKGGYWQITAIHNGSGSGNWHNGSAAQRIYPNYIDNNTGYAEFYMTFHPSTSYTGYGEPTLVIRGGNYLQTTGEIAISYNGRTNSPSSGTFRALHAQYQWMIYNDGDTDAYSGMRSIDRYTQNKTSAFVDDTTHSIDYIASNDGRYGTNSEPIIDQRSYIKIKLNGASGNVAIQGHTVFCKFTCYTNGDKEWAAYMYYG